MHKIAVSYFDDNKKLAAENLARDLQLPFIQPSQLSEYDYLLAYSASYLCLYQTSEKHLAHPFFIDFLSKKMLYRLKHAAIHNELLARALGKQPKENPIIVDATAGLGRDSFLLAALGFNVTLLEQSPVVHALLSDAILRASRHPETVSVTQRMQLILTDAIPWLAQHPADIVYLDPMFPARQKSASVKKEMVILQNLLGKSDKNTELLSAALACAHYRIVVKRPRLAENLSSKRPNFTLWGKTSRFDVYLGK